MPVTEARRLDSFSLYQCLLVLSVRLIFCEWLPDSLRNNECLSWYTRIQTLYWFENSVWVAKNYMELFSNILKRIYFVLSVQLSKATIQKGILSVIFSFFSLEISTGSLGTAMFVIISKKQFLKILVDKK